MTPEAREATAARDGQADAIVDPIEAPSPRRFLYVLAIAYLALDYARPQDTFATLGVIRPAMIVTIMLAVVLLANHRLWPRRNPQLRAMWVFALVLAAHVPFARNNRFAFMTFQAMILLFPFVVALPTSIVTLPRLKKTLAICLLFTGYQALYSVFHGGKGTGSQFFDENDLSLFLNTFLPVAYFLFIVERRLTGRLFYLGVLLSCLAANVVAMSRGGFLGLLVMGLVVWLVSPRKVLSLAIIAVLAGGFVQLAGEKYWHEMSTSTDAESGTGRERIESWKSGWKMFLANPLGVGGGNFQVRFPQYQTDYFKRGMWGRVAHSLWITLIAELGIPGILVYLFLLGVNLRDSLTIRRLGRTIGGADGGVLAGLGAAFLASIAGFLASGTFLSVLYYPHYWYLTGLIVATKGIAVQPTRFRKG